MKSQLVVITKRVPTILGTEMKALGSHWVDVFRKNSPRPNITATRSKNPLGGSTLTMNEGSGDEVLILEFSGCTMLRLDTVRSVTVSGGMRVDHCGGPV